MKLKRIAGVTLIEMLVAIGIFAMASVPVIKFFLDSFEFQSRNQKTTQTNAVASFVVEQLKKGLGVSYLSSTHSSFTLDEFCTVTGATNQFGRDFNITMDSARISQAISDSSSYIDVPETFDGVLTVNDDGLSYAKGTSNGINLTINGSIVTITSISSGNNKLRIIKNCDVHPLIKVQNDVSEKLKLYKDKNVSISVIAGDVSVINLSGNDNNVYNLYKLIITVSDGSDASVISKLDTSIKVMDNLK